MENWPCEQRSFVDISHYKNNDCVVAVQLQFKIKFNIAGYGRVPSAHATKNWVRKFEETGSAGHSKHKGTNRSVRSFDNIIGVRSIVEGRPKHRK